MPARLRVILHSPNENPPDFGKKPETNQQVFIARQYGEN
jgi:hypothetical protein